MMMTIGTRDENNFVESLISSHLLRDAIDWIKSNLEPDDVFSEADLDEWANDNGYEKVDE